MGMGKHFEGLIVVAGIDQCLTVGSEKILVLRRFHQGRLQHGRGLALLVKCREDMRVTERYRLLAGVGSVALAQAVGLGAQRFLRTRGAVDSGGWIVAAQAPGEGKSDSKRGYAGEKFAPPIRRAGNAAAMRHGDPASTVRERTNLRP